MACVPFLIVGVAGKQSDEALSTGRKQAKKVIIYIRRITYMYVGVILFFIVYYLFFYLGTYIRMYFWVFGEAIFF